MSDAENRAVVERLVQALNEGDAGAFADCFTEDVEIQWMASGRRATGRQAAYAWIADALETFEGLSNEVVGIYPGDDTVVLEVIARGRQVKAFHDTPPGRELNQPELYVYRFRDGKIREAKRY